MVLSMSKHWYVIHTYSGHENKVKSNLERAIASAGLQGSFGEILVATEEFAEMKGGKRREIQRKFFPGYIIVEMEMSDEAWHLVKNTPKVTGSVGSGKEPTPLTAEARSASKVLGPMPQPRITPSPYPNEKGDAAAFDSVPGSGFDTEPAAAAIVPPAGRVSGTDRRGRSPCSCCPCRGRSDAGRSR